MRELGLIPAGVRIRQISLACSLCFGLFPSFGIALTQFPSFYLVLLRSPLWRYFGALSLAFLFLRLDPIRL